MGYNFENEEALMINIDHLARLMSPSHQNFDILNYYVNNETGKLILQTLRQSLLCRISSIIK